MQPVANTPEILYYKVTGKHVDDVWVQWAIDMLEAGFDTEHLRILAGETKPFNYWYLKPLTDRVFSELGTDVSDVAGITHTYICFIIGEALSSKRTFDRVLSALYDFSYEEQLREALSDFYFLYYAMQDLKHDTVQFYWPDANRKNINDIIRARFEEWVRVHGRSK